MNQPLTQPKEQKSAVFLLSGFLGAGKTTLLKRILAWESDLSDTVVLVNEFGDVGIDGDLLKNSGSDVVELTSGCICCTLSADLKQLSDEHLGAVQTPTYLHRGIRGCRSHRHSGCINGLSVY